MEELNSDHIAHWAAWVRAFERLETPRINARRFRVDDAVAFQQAMRGDRVSQWIGGFVQPFDESAARRWLSPRLDRMERGEGVYGAVCYRDSDVLMGFFYAVLNVEHGGVEIAGGLNEVYWGKGFVEEFTFALINEVFRVGAPSVLATCALHNWSSMRVLQAFNFTEIGVKTLDTPQGPRVSRLYRLTPAAWRSARILPLHDGLDDAEIRARRRALLAMCRELKNARDYVQREPEADVPLI